MAEEYGKIRKSLMVGIADAIRAKKDTTAIFTPEQMAVEIEGIVTGDDLPNAEDVSHGTPGDAVEYGILSESTSSGGSISTNRGYRFTMSETMACLGIRAKYNSTQGYETYLYLWDAETETLIKKITKASIDTTQTWVEYRFDAPINLLAGKTYAVSFRRCSGVGINTLTFNPKLTNVKWVNATSADAYPTASMTTKYCVDIILGQPITESVVTEYKIQSETLDSIADEVKRITGETATLSPAQIITALQGIATPTTE